MRRRVHNYAREDYTVSASHWFGRWRVEFSHFPRYFGGETEFVVTDDGTLTETHVSK